MCEYRVPFNQSKPRDALGSQMMHLGVSSFARSTCRFEKELRVEEAGAAKVCSAALVVCAFVFVGVGSCLDMVV